MGEVEQMDVLSESKDGQINHVISLKFKGGGLGALTLTSALCYYKPFAWFEVIGHRDCLRSDNFDSLLYRRTENKRTADFHDFNEIPPDYVWETIPRFPLHGIYRYGYYHDLEIFFNSVRGTAVNRATLMDGYKSLQLVEEIMRQTKF